MGGRSESDVIVDPKEEVYPGAPLRAVAMEVYFRGVLDALARLATFQRKHADEFERMYVPRSERPDESEDFDLLRPVLLHGRERGVAVASNQATVITYKYDGGFTAFSGWGFPMLREALGTIGVIGDYTRVRFRYENLIPARAKGAFDLGRFFNLPLPKGPNALSEVRNDVRLAWKQMWPAGHVAVDLSVDVGAADDGDDLVVVSIVSERKGAVAPADLEAALGEAHKMARWTWEALITDEFREELRRGT